MNSHRPGLNTATIGPLILPEALEPQPGDPLSTSLDTVMTYTIKSISNIEE